MLFSIIVPVYNTEKYLKQCIESILEQSFKDFELILVDDGSMDNSPEICDSFAVKDSRVKVIHQKNAGVVKARKTGLVNSKGSYIITVDSDDYVDKKMLEKIYNAILENNCDMVAFGARAVDGKKQEKFSNALLPGCYGGYKIEEIYKDFMFIKSKKTLNFGNMLFSLWSKAIKRELLEEFQLQTPEEINKGDDLAVVAPIIYRCKKIIVIDECFYFYRVNPESIMHCFSEKDAFSLKALVTYLKPICQNEYEINLYMCVTKMFLEHLAGIIKGSSNYSEFKEKAKRFYNICGNDLISCFDIRGLYLKDKVLVICAKYKLILLLYVLYKVKEKI